MKNKHKHSLSLTLNPDTTPILYTDEIHISTNDYGVVMDIVQKIGDDEQGRVVSRVGMSRDHAVAFTQELGKLLLLTEKKKTDKPN